MPAYRNPIEIAAPGLPTIWLPNTLIEAAVRQFTPSVLTDYTSTVVLGYDQPTRRYMAINPAQAASGECYITQSGSRWALMSNYNGVGTGNVVPYHLVSNGIGRWLLAGYNATPTASKIRYTDDGGGTWVSAHVGGDDTGAISGLGYCASLDMWFASHLNSGVYNSTDGGVTWDLRSAVVNSFTQFLVRNGPSPLIVAIGAATRPGPGYYTSVDGVVWTSRTFPENTAQTRGCYSDYWKTFYAHSAAHTYISSDGIDWTVLDDYPTALSAHNHLLLSSDGYVSSDGGYVWTSVMETFGGTADWISGAGDTTMFREGENFFRSTALHL